MPIFTKPKRVTDPLDDRVKDRIVGRYNHHLHHQPAYVSSGSEHSADDDDVLLDCFLHDDYRDDDCNTNSYVLNDNFSDKVNDHDNNDEIDSDPECESDRTDAIIEKLNSIYNNQNVDRFRNVLLANVSKAVEVFRSQKPNKQILNRNVMLFLQKIGYNAAVCKTKWQSCGGLTAGSYEFIDVIRSGSDSGTRYFIDVNFSGEFDIARETEHFRRVFNKLPPVFVGKSEDLKKIVKVLTEATRRSLKSRGLLLPPWRKNRFMQSKWFGPYRRTVNYTPASVPPVFNKPAELGVECRRIGFNAVNAPLLPAATRTR